MKFRNFVMALVSVTLLAGNLPARADEPKGKPGQTALTNGTISEYVRELMTIGQQTGFQIFLLHLLEL